MKENKVSWGMYSWAHHVGSEYYDEYSFTWHIINWKRMNSKTRLRPNDLFWHLYIHRPEPKFHEPSIFGYDGEPAERGHNKKHKRGVFADRPKK